jgi:hypothetical protein
LMLKKNYCKISLLLVNEFSSKTVDQAQMY